MNQPNNQLHQATEQKVQGALLALLERQPLSKLTVRVICEQAQVNRATFYRHYQDIFDLMEKTERRMNAGLAKLYANRFGQPIELLLGREHLIPMIEYIGEHRAFYREYLRTHPLGMSEGGFQIVWDGYFKPLFQSVGVEDEGHMAYYYRFFKAGMTNVLGYWLEQGCPEPPEELAELLYNMMHTETLALRLTDADSPPGTGRE